MSLSGLLRVAWIAVPTALVCGGAVAQQIIPVPSGVVVILTPGQMPGTAKTPVLVETQQAAPIAVSPGSIERLIADQQAIMDRMMADMNAMFAPMASPTQMIRAMMGPGGGMPAAVGSYCEQSISVTYNGRGTRPVVKVSRSGTGCGPAAGTASMPTLTTPPAQRGPRILNISNPSEPARPQHRT